MTFKIILAHFLFTLVVVSASGCSELLVSGPDENQNLADFEAVWSITNSEYPFFQFKGIDWDAVHSSYRPLAEQAKGDEIVQVLFDMLSELKDAHVRLSTKGGFDTFIIPYDSPRSRRDRLAFNPSIVRNYFAGELDLTASRNIEYGIAGGNIGYIRLSTFESGNWIFEFDEVLARLAATRALIVDVRNNDGGSFQSTDFVIGRFLTAPISSLPTYGHAQLQPSYLIRPRGPFAYSDSIVVLANGGSASASDGFVEIMKQIPSVTVVGDTTAGAGGDTQRFSLPSGRQIRLSVKDICRYDGNPIEWNGVAPDVRVRQIEADTQEGRDRQLEYALQLLRQ